MDKNTITGLVLIAILLVGFSFLSRPSQEQLEAQQRYYDSPHCPLLPRPARHHLAGKHPEQPGRNNRRYKRRTHSFGHTEGIHGTRQDDPRHTVQRQ